MLKIDKPCLGIYFGQKEIRIIERKARKAAAFCTVALFDERITPSEVDEETKIVAGLRESLRIANIETKKAVIALASKDIILRSFTIPYVPKEELAPTIYFELKKYIPFKVEELTCDFQVRPKKKDKGLEVLLTAIKKDILERYLTILDKCEIEPIAVEPGVLSLLRLLKSKRLVTERERLAILHLDFLTHSVISTWEAPSEESHAKGEIIFVEYGILKFSQEISASDKKEAIFTKLLSSLSISMSYYRRQFSSLGVDKLIFISREQVPEWNQTLSKEMGMPVRFIGLKEILPIKKEELNLGFALAWGASWKPKVKVTFDLDFRRRRLLAPALEKEREAAPKERPLPVAWGAILGSLLCIGLILLGIYLYGQFRTTLLNKELKQIIEQRQRPIQSSVEELESAKSNLKRKFSSLDNVLKRWYISPKLEALSRIAPKGVWLKNISTEADKGTMDIRGSAYLGEEREEDAAVKEFLSRLKASLEFSKDFSSIHLKALKRNRVRKYSLTDFEISCKR